MSILPFLNDESQHINDSQERVETSRHLIESNFYDVLSIASTKAFNTIPPLGTNFAHKKRYRSMTAEYSLISKPPSLVDKQKQESKHNEHDDRNDDHNDVPSTFLSNTGNKQCLHIGELSENYVVPPVLFKYSNKQWENILTCLGTLNSSLTLSDDVVKLKEELNMLKNKQLEYNLEAIEKIRSQLESKYEDKLKEITMEHHTKYDLIYKELLEIKIRQEIITTPTLQLLRSGSNGSTR